MRAQYAPHLRSYDHNARFYARADSARFGHYGLLRLQPVATARRVRPFDLRSCQIPFKHTQSRQIEPSGLSNWPIRFVKLGEFTPFRPPTYATGSLTPSTFPSTAA